MVVVRRLWLPCAIVALVVAAGIPLYRYAMDPASFPIDRLLVEGEFLHVDRTAVQRVVEPHARLGFFACDIEAVRDAVREIPWVDWVAVQREWPDTLHVRIVEQQPIARWHGGGLVNIRGELFAPDKISYPQQLAELSGPAGSVRQVSDRYRALSKQLATVNLSIKALSLDERRAWTVTLDDEVRLVLGRNADHRRLQKFIHVYPKTLAARLDQVQQVDLRYPNGFAVQWRPGTDAAASARAG
jgi:cell division protein FtsQ